MPGSSSTSKVNFFFEQKDFNLKNRITLKSFIEAIFKREKKKLRFVNYIFCSDKRLLGINRQFLNHDYYTDIISFDLSEDEFTEGEIYISVDRVRENSSKLGTSFSSEILRVIFHGALHLCGYEDNNQKNRQIMNEKENQAIRLYRS